MSAPQIPPRPTRSQQQHTLAAEDATPQVPPRPTRKNIERSRSPGQENFPRSPFNEPPSHPLTLTKTQSQEAFASGLPPRPPSVSLPSVGQEGNEYADIEYSNGDAVADDEDVQNESPKETRNIAGDLPLHAPTPSFATSSAKKRVATVTRTDSSQAAAVGIGKAPTPISANDDIDPLDRKSRVSFRTASSASTERPGSLQERPDSAQAEDDHGIPEIGQRVPMYPDAGDVQAPSPSPFQQQFPAGIGFHNSGIAKPGSRQHRRTPSGRDALPPGSYGMHGHGVPSADRFEQDWYAKHPEALQKEEGGEYGPGIGGGRGGFALSSDDLNKLVRETSRTTSAAGGLPNEQIGYKASEDYASRMATPPLSATGTFKMAHSNASQPHVESPLRKASFPVDPDAGQIIQKTRSYDTSSSRNESALESETEDESTHVAMPSIRKSKYTGNGYDPPTQDLRPEGGNTPAQGGYLEETGYGVPILASDEVAKTPGMEFMQPAVSPAQERRGSNYYTGIDGHGEYQGGLGSGSRPSSAANSRPSSRPGSIYSFPNLSRFSTHDEDRENMHTPLEDVDEYEPLFPDEEGNKVRKTLTPAQRLKMRETLKRFPSQDIWEDTPKSLQLQATVETPEPGKQATDPLSKPAAATFETAEQEAARKGEVSESDKARLLPREERLAKSIFQPHIQDEMHRPSSRQRFPSRDIWEDSPDSAQFTTVVGEGPQTVPDAGLEAGAVVQTSGSPRDGIIAGDQSRDNATAGAAAMPAEKPSIPPRPTKGKHSPHSGDATIEKDATATPSIPARPPKRLHQVPPADAPVPIAPSKLSQDTSRQISPTDTHKPSLPDRPKPSIPTRPTKLPARDSTETLPLSQVTSATSISSSGSNEINPPPPSSAPMKAKPAIPARPIGGGKIAGLKAGFMGDLESRLKLGPKAPPKPQEVEKVPDPEAETKPLEDARKGRAKGPAKRRPVPTTAAVASGPSSSSESKSSWGVQQPWTVWSTDGTGPVRLGTIDEAAAPAEGMLSSKREEPAEVSEPAAPPPAAAEPGQPPSEDLGKAKEAGEEPLHKPDPLTQEHISVPAPSSKTDDLPASASASTEQEASPDSEVQPSKAGGGLTEAVPAPPAPAEKVASPIIANEKEESQSEVKNEAEAEAPVAAALAAIGPEESHGQDDSFAGDKHVSEI